jgi:hypothetical protein
MSLARQVASIIRPLAREVISAGGRFLHLSRGPDARQGQHRHDHERQQLQGQH